MKFKRSHVWDQLERDTVMTFKEIYNRRKSSFRFTLWLDPTKKKKAKRHHVVVVPKNLRRPPEKSLRFFSSPPHPLEKASENTKPFFLLVLC